MPVTRTHDYAVAPGKSLVTIADWVKTLPTAEREAYNAAFEAQQELLELHQDQGYIISITDDVVVYSDEAIEKSKRGQFSYVVPEWKAFFDRFQLETGVIYNPTMEKSE